MAHYLFSQRCSENTTYQVKTHGQHRDFWKVPQMIPKESIVHLQLIIECKHGIIGMQKTEECFLYCSNRQVWAGKLFSMEYGKNLPVTWGYIKSCTRTMCPTQYFLGRLVQQVVHPKHIHKSVLPRALHLHAAHFS